MCFLAVMGVSFNSVSVTLYCSSKLLNWPISYFYQAIRDINSS